MTRIACVADVHLDNHRLHGGEVVNGVNTRCRQALEAFRGAVWKAKAEGCTTLVVSGDLFDTSRPTPQIIAAVQDILAERGTMQIVLLVGNHDQHTSGANDNAMAPLREWARVVETPELVRVESGALIACVPFASQPAANWFVETVEELGKKANGGEVAALYVHLGLSDSETPPWLQNAKDAIAASTARAAATSAGFPAVFAGNWHNRQVWEPEAEGGPIVVQCGALVPTGWDNPGIEDYGGLVVYDTSTGSAEIHDIPGPRFVKVRNDAELKKAERAAKIGKHHLYARLSVDAEGLPAALEAVDNARSRGIVLDVAVDGSEEQAAAASAAYAATQAESLDEAVAAYIGQMALPPETDRAAIVAKTMGFLK